MTQTGSPGTRRYELRDRGGSVEAVHLRTDRSGGTKTFRWEQPDGTRGLGGRPVETLPLYGFERFPEPSEQVPLYLTEGEKSADALVEAGLPALGTATGAATVPDDEALSVLVGYEVLLWPDNDDPGRRHMDRIYHALVELGAIVSVVDWREAPKGGDAADFLAEGRTAKDVIALPIVSAPLEIEGWAESIGEDTAGYRNVSAQTSTLKGAERNLPFMTAREFAAATPPDVDWIAKPWVAGGSITAISGKIKAAGKTTLATHLCRAVLDGREFLGQVTRQTAVVFLTEQPPTSLRETLRRADLLDQADFTFLTFGRTAGVPWEDVIATAVAECGRRSASLLVVDTLSRFAGIKGDGENDAGAADTAMAPLLLAAEHGLNQCPCTSWRTCGREYWIREYDESTTPWRSIRRVHVVDIRASGVRWASGYGADVLSEPLDDGAAQ